ncbi:MAG: 16S rRNA (guanine(966)-N(2))-methyltransferase RsmD [Nitrospiraceae bacterium]|nr:16S rRNA (guanine(966)-N(2))-methyltransferase RsmD [Nitrospiraceae bacterium]
MRISAGHLKGRRVAFQGVFSKKTGADELRPTSAKVREALFDILRNDVQDSSFLDLYSGTGAVGFEALSRGARKVVFVELNQELHRSIVDCIGRIGLVDKAEAHRAKVMDFIRRSGGCGERFDIIFADPPYASEETAQLMPIIDSIGLLRESGCLVIEHATKSAMGHAPAAGTLRHVKDYRYGDTMLTLYRKGTPQ